MKHRDIAERNQKIVDYVRAHPDLKQKDIAEKFGMDQSWLSAICREEGLFREETGGRVPFDQLQLELRRKVVVYLQRNLDATYRQAGEIFGLTVWQAEQAATVLGLPRRRIGRRLGQKMSDHTRAAIRRGYQKWKEKKNSSLS